MVTVRILKRKDAASVVVAVVLAMIVVQFLSIIVLNWSQRLSHVGLDSSYPVNYGGWRDTYLNPFITLVLSLIVLEVLLRLVVWLHPMFVRRGRK